jgi:dipeptidyl aminopeptidase/acylaminoacyl peptidase
MKKARWFVAFITCLSVSPCRAQQLRTVEPSDCVTVRYLLHDESLRSPLQVNGQSTMAAYLVKSPDIRTNENNIDLFVVDIAARSNGSPRLLAHQPGMSQLHWMADGSHLVLLLKYKGLGVVAQINARTGRTRVLAALDTDITEFSVSQDASVFVVATNKATMSEGKPHRTDSEIAEGFRIPFQTAYVFAHPEKQLYLFRRNVKGQGYTPQRLSIVSPFTKHPVIDLFCVLNLRLSLSPNGKYVTVTYLEHGNDVPNEWRSDHRVSDIIGRSGELQITVVVDLDHHSSSIPLKTPWSYSIPLWSRDSESFIEVAKTPLGSGRDDRDEEVGAERIHMYQANIRNGDVHLVEEHVESPYAQPLWWKSDGDLAVRTDGDTVSHLGFTRGKWQEIAKTVVLLPKTSHVTDMASSGGLIIAGSESAAIPPELFQYDARLKTATILMELNPQLANVSLAPSREVKWATSSGYQASGLLVQPIGFQEGVRYPLVLQMYPVYDGGFVCDSGSSHDPGFAPQPLANAGVMYLIRIRRDGGSSTADAPYFQKGYPGGIGEAAFQMDLADSAIKSLSTQGIVDTANVGISGFSRSGWYTDFTITNSPFRYKAASIADGGQYSLGEYWLLHSERTIDPYDALYGGPPYGESLRNWLKYSVSFNFDKWHTPLLMEEMGYSVPYDTPDAPPITLAVFFEQFTALNRLRVPVELYYYPNEEHQPDHPRARLASLQRNLDWYRFWLQGYERPTVEDRQQYLRWHKMVENNVNQK